MFEMSQIGGRLETVLVNGRDYEIGGSVIHPLNMYMAGFLPICGLNKTKEPDLQSTYSLHKDGAVTYQVVGPTGKLQEYSQTGETCLANWQFSVGDYQDDLEIRAVFSHQYVQPSQLLS